LVALFETALQVASDADGIGHGGPNLTRDCMSAILLAAENATQSALDAIQVVLLTALGISYGLLGWDAGLGVIS
jgi:hypothetical protein